MLPKGYSVLDAETLDLFNAITDTANRIGRQVAVLRAGGETVDQRWVAIGTTHLQQGFMALKRAVTQPDNF